MDSFSHTLRDKKTKKEEIWNQNTSITKRLLEKYRPSKDLKLIDNVNRRIDSNKAA